MVERFNFEINMRALMPIRRLINYLRELGRLSKENLVEVHAFSCLAKPILQYGLDLLYASWNHHGVAARKGCAPGTWRSCPTPLTLLAPSIR